jgi:hypothetical protein
VQDRDRPGRCGVDLAKHRAHARRSQAAFSVPRSELRKLLPGNYFLPSGQLLRVRQDELSAWNGLIFARNELRFCCAGHRVRWCFRTQCAGAPTLRSVPACLE